ncbi:hypothetical protein B0F90DRAFT_1689186 [Multifurca ochricompacta]|uniref:Sulphur transport domain-containing protein n=1 Tax=Multifurca ochricompacta TaxID=376703 RepID=A0AAD4MA48_9AGAM|nr:hypothetical protein B0F90DRAFT_1689186 [Multifurca ochricompacta]
MYPSSPSPGPTPLQSFLGGVCLALPVQTFLSLNKNTFGISGFIYGAARGNTEDTMSVLGLILGGVAVAFIEGGRPPIRDPALLPLILSGLLVGVGAKMSNGCTSGHMICGLSHFSIRSIAATATFCVTASLTAHFLHDALTPIPGDPSLGAHGSAFLTSGAAALVLTLASSRLIRAVVRARQAIAFCTAFAFATALRLSNLSDPRRVLAFLLTPAHTAFDSSLVYLAIGAIPLAAVLYHVGTVRVPRKGRVDARLLTGAALFGIGWGIEGICPGPGLINFGWALATGSGIMPLGMWLTAVIIGGSLVPS